MALRNACHLGLQPIASDKRRECKQTDDGCSESITGSENAHFKVIVAFRVTDGDFGQWTEVVRHCPTIHFTTASEESDGKMEGLPTERLGWVFAQDPDFGVFG